MKRDKGGDKGGDKKKPVEPPEYCELDEYFACTGYNCVFYKLCSLPNRGT